MTTGVPFEERGGKLRGVVDLAAGRYPSFLLGGPVGDLLPVFHFHDVTRADLEAKGAATKLLIVDASRRNPYERRFRGLSIGLAPISTPAGTLIIYAAAPGNVARDGESEHSLLAAGLLHEIRSDKASAEEVFNRTSTSAARASAAESSRVV